MFTLTTFSNVAMKVIAKTVRQGKENKEIQVGKDKEKLSLSTDDTIYT